MCIYDSSFLAYSVELHVFKSWISEVKYHSTRISHRHQLLPQEPSTYVHTATQQIATRLSANPSCDPHAGPGTLVSWPKYCFTLPKSQRVSQTPHLSRPSLLDQSTSLPNTCLPACLPWEMTEHARCAVNRLPACQRASGMRERQSE